MNSMPRKPLRLVAALLCVFILLVTLVRLMSDWRIPRSPIQTVSIESSPAPAFPTATTTPGGTGKQPPSQARAALGTRLDQRGSRARNPAP